MYKHATFREFEHYAQGVPTDALARRLRCTGATISAWLSGRRAPPWWVPELLRLQEMERDDMARQMGYAKALPRLGVVRGEVIDLQRRRTQRTQKSPDGVRALPDDTALMRA